MSSSRRLGGCLLDDPRGESIVTLSLDAEPPCPGQTTGKPGDSTCQDDGVTRTEGRRRGNSAEKAGNEGDQINGRRRLNQALFMQADQHFVTHPEGLAAGGNADEIEAITEQP